MTTWLLLLPSRCPAHRSSVVVVTTPFSTRLEPLTSTGDLTIFGGAGADVMAGTSSAAEAGVVFGYSAFSDSTLSSMDTIAHGLGTGTTVAFNYIPGGLTRASNFDESGAAFNYTATDGVVTFSGTTYSELTARVESLDSTSHHNWCNCGLQGC